MAQPSIAGTLRDPALLYVHTPSHIGRSSLIVQQSRAMCSGMRQSKPRSKGRKGTFVALTYGISAQVPAGKAECVWDSARVHELDAEHSAQLKHAVEAKNGHAWLLLEYMDRGPLQARCPLLT